MCMLFIRIKLRAFACNFRYHDVGQGFRPRFRGDFNLLFPAGINQYVEYMSGSGALPHYNVKIFPPRISI